VKFTVPAGRGGVSHVTVELTSVAVELYEPKMHVRLSFGQIPVEVAVTVILLYSVVFLGLRLRSSGAPASINQSNSFEIVIIP